MRLAAAWCALFSATSVCAHRLDDKARCIPKVIFTTGPFEPKVLEDVDDKFMPPGSEMRFYNDEQMHSSARRIAGDLEKKGIVPGALSAYENVRPGAYRADLWRLFQLWDGGGIYMDAKLVLQGDLESIVNFDRADEFVICSDEPSSTTNRPLYWNGFMASAPRHPTILATIRLTVKHIQEHYYGPPPEKGQELNHADLYITGPGVVSEAMNTTGVVSTRRCEFARNPNWYERIINGIPFKDNLHLLPSGKLIAISSAAVHDGMRACKTCLPYTELYKEHKVFCDEEGPPCPKKQVAFLQAETEDNYWAKKVGVHNYWRLRW